PLPSERSCPGHGDQVFLAALYRRKCAGRSAMRRGVLIRRVILVTCSLMFLAIVLGCMSLSIGGRQGGSSCEDGVSEHSGEVKVSAGRELDVYYPVPFASPPNLTLADDCDHVVQVEGRPDNFDCVLLEQQFDHFRVKNVGKFCGV